jgi:hypothetical protein
MFLTEQTTNLRETHTNLAMEGKERKEKERKGKEACQHEN